MMIWCHALRVGHSFQDGNVESLPVDIAATGANIRSLQSTGPNRIFDLYTNKLANSMVWWLESSSLEPYAP